VPCSEYHLLYIVWITGTHVKSTIKSMIEDNRFKFTTTTGTALPHAYRYPSVATSRIFPEPFSMIIILNCANVFLSPIFYIINKITKQLFKSEKLNSYYLPSQVGVFTFFSPLKKIKLPQGVYSPMTNVCVQSSVANSWQPLLCDENKRRLLLPT
jgi:hypothetical protein